MSRVQTTPNMFQDQKTLEERVSALERIVPGRAAIPGAMSTPTYAMESSRQPSTIRPTWVTVSLQNNGGGSDGYVYLDANNPPTTEIARFYQAAGGVEVVPFSFLVPAGFYYKLHQVVSFFGVNDGPHEWVL